MKEKRIEFATAKLAKEKGFDIETYELDYMVDGNYPEKQGACVSCTTYIKCSTQTLLQKWLREVHNIDVSPYVIEMESNNRTLSQDLETKEYHYHLWKDGIKEWAIGRSYKTYEDALETGLQEALKLI